MINLMAEAHKSPSAAQTTDQSEAVLGRGEADLIGRGDGGAGGARGAGGGQRVPCVVATRGRCGHLDPRALAAVFGVGHPGFQKLLPVPVCTAEKKSTQVK